MFKIVITTVKFIGQIQYYIVIWSNWASRAFAPPGKLLNVEKCI